MSHLSISKAWDETRAVIAHDSRLLTSLALALVALPAAITALINPRGMTDASTPFWVDLVVLVASLVVLAGQLALIRMALGPAITVASAIQHGFRRMPVYLVTAIILICLLLVAAIPFVLVLIVAGVRMESEAQLAASPAFWAVAMLYFVFLCWIGVRMLMSSAVASGEPVGSLAIIRRSWELTAGHFWRLFGFLLLFFIAAGIAVVSLGSVVGLLVTQFLGPIEPMTVSALAVALVQALAQAVMTTLLAVMLARIYVQLAGRTAPEVSVPTSGI